MSEEQSRPHGSRGRGGFRGGRGGYRGARTGSKSHSKSDEQNNQSASLEEEGEVGELKRRYGDKVTSLRELCGGWSDEDIVYALKETDGDANLAFDRIQSGAISQWGEVGKKKPSKTKDLPSTSSETTGSVRGGRGRGTIDGRGRGRGAERGRVSRGGRASTQSNGTKPVAKATEEGWGDSTAPATVTATGGWDAPTNGAAGTSSTSDWANDVSAQTAVPEAADKKAEAVAASKSKVGGWAGLFAKPPPAPKKVPIPISVMKAEEFPSAPAMDETIPQDGLPPPVEQQNLQDGPIDLPEAATDTPITLTPSKDELTETNLEQLPDTSGPPATATAASTVASTVDPLSTMNTSTPVVRPGMSGYAASALKATGAGGVRSSSFNRRVVEQQEAVVMPGKHAVDRAAVQFGSMGLNGSGEDLDVDEDREEPETRTQLPDDSPAAPRASLPPSIAQAQAPAAEDYSELVQAPRPAPGLPPAGQQQSGSPPIGTGYGEQFHRYGQAAQKAYDPFAQQPAQSQPPPTQSQEAFSSQLPSTSQASAPNDYSNYYNTNSREYQNYYGQAYGQAQETQQRSGSAFGSSSQDVQSQYVTSRPQQPSYGQQEAQNSGHNTPNPTMQGHQAQHSQQHMQHGQSGYAGYQQYGYPNAYTQQQYPQYAGQQQSYMNQMGGRYGSNRPMFDDVRRQGGQDSTPQQHQDVNQFPYGYNQQQYGAGYNKSSMYGQPQHQYSYEHSASPANAGGYGQSGMAGREAVYGRAGSAQPSEGQQATTGNTFGGMPDPFGRTQSGFGNQAQGLSQQASDDPAKPSPSIAAANRPGSAVNNVPGQQSGQASTFPNPQSQHSGQQPFGGYPQYGGGHHQGQGNHPQTAGYGGGFGGSNAAFSQYGQYGSGRGYSGQYGGAH